MTIGRFFSIIYDYLVNRVRRIYIGTKPKNPNKLIIPQFVTIQKDSVRSIDILTSKLELRLIAHPVIISDVNTWDIAGRNLFEEFQSINISPNKYIASSNKYLEVMKAVKTFSSKPRFWKQNESVLGNQLYSIKHASIIISVGGGMIVDFGKLMAKIMNIPFISIPTSLANDGIASPFAVIDPSGYSDDDIHKSMQTFTPLGVVVNIKCIKHSSKGDSNEFLLNMVRSGIGDSLSNITACLDWQLAFENGKEQMNYMALHQSSSAGETILANIKA